MPKPLRTMLSIQAIPDINNIKVSQLCGQDHTVIPCVALVEGVLWPANAPGPELALAEEFGRFPEGWNGRPVTFGHPMVNNQPVSASSPEVLEDNSFGQLFNTSLEDGKLKTEIWINEARITDLGEDAQEAIESLKTGEGIAEVSTGLFTMSEPVQGVHDGKDYESIWRNIVPDHLAVLPEGIIGACSVEDGCGAPRANQMQPVMRAAQLNANCECSLTNSDSSDPEEEKGLFRRILELAGGVLGFASNSKGLSDSDLRTALNAGLKSSEPDSYFWILAVYPEADDTGRFVYELGWDGSLFERTFEINEGAISLGSTPTAVRPVTTFVAVEITASSEPNTNSMTQENAMSKEKLVNDLIANEATQFTEDNREWLDSLEETVLETLNPVVPEIVKDPEVVAEPATNAAAEPAPEPTAPVTTAEYIAAAPAEIQIVLNASLSLHQKRKDALVKGLLSNTRCSFTEATLQSKQVDELEQLADLAAVEVSYAGNGSVTTNQDDAEQGFTPAPTIFQTNADQE